MASFVAHGAAIMAALLKLVAWGTTKVAVIEGRIGTLERAVDNDITGRRVVAQIVNDVAVIKSEIAEVQHVLREDGHHDA
ncbi:hypothetical protein [Niveispirillum sp.]|uniref:hypothetical protein n=1 Tax=Niveispirillum sp. TaxID=1917217 RepID=UPI001B62A98F|nr:hypothetical protein [Niveispirillum sp.]MBP7338706.1 hypothetical protein [Niveispirillum sp.]